MNEILKQTFTVRLNENGKEVEKPEGYDACNNSGIGGTSGWGFVKYSQATEAIKLPTLIEFVGYLRGINGTDSWSLTKRYSTFLQTQLSKGQFVNELVEPENYSEFHINKLSSGNEFAKWHDECIQFQKAEEAVIFVESCLYHKVYLVTKQFDTINQALNQGVVFYMKIK